MVAGSDKPSVTAQNPKVKFTRAREVRVQIAHFPTKYIITLLYDHG